MANIANNTNHFILLFLAIFFISFKSSNATFINVVSFGARPDGPSDSTAAFLRAWSSACSSTDPATIHVPRGSLLLKEVTFFGPCKNKIEFKMDGSTLVAPSNIWSDGNAGYWILFRMVNELSLYGGTLSAMGRGFWACRRGGKSCPAGARVCAMCLKI